MITIITAKYLISVLVGFLKDISSEAGGFFHFNSVHPKGIDEWIKVFIAYFILYTICKLVYKIITHDKHTK